MANPYTPMVSPHAAIRFRQRFAPHMTDNASALEIMKLVKAGDRWGPSSKGDWHLAATFNNEWVVLAMTTDRTTGRPSVVTVLTLPQATANQKRAWR